MIYGKAVLNVYMNRYRKRERQRQIQIPGGVKLFEVQKLCVPALECGNPITRYDAVRW